jgi:hypothetical protein
MLDSSALASASLSRPAGAGPGPAARHAENDAGSHAGSHAGSRAARSADRMNYDTQDTGFPKHQAMQDTRPARTHDPGHDSLQQPQRHGTDGAVHQRPLLRHAQLCLQKGKDVGLRGHERAERKTLRLGGLGPCRESRVRRVEHSAGQAALQPHLFAVHVVLDGGVHRLGAAAQPLKHGLCLLHVQRGAAQHGAARRSTPRRCGAVNAACFGKARRPQSPEVSQPSWVAAAPSALAAQRPAGPPTGDPGPQSWTAPGVRNRPQSTASLRSCSNRCAAAKRRRHGWSRRTLPAPSRCHSPR